MAMTTRCARAFSPRWHVSCSIGVDFKAMLKLAWQSSRLSRAGTTHTDVIRAWTISLPWRMKRGITTWSNSNVQLSTKPGQLQRQREQREVEPNSSLGKAFSYWLEHWPSLTRFLSVPGAPLENNTAERALKLIIRQRKNSLFYATPHSAYVASLLTSLIATCIQAGVNAMAYLVALQEHRSAVFANPAEWLPWTFQATLALC